MVREVHRIGAARVHDVDLGVAVTFSGKRDLHPVRGPGRLPVLACVGRQSDHVRPVRIHHIDLSVAVLVRPERDFGAVWRPGGLVVIDAVAKGQSRRIAAVRAHYVEMVMDRNGRVGPLVRHVDDL